MPTVETNIIFVFVDGPSDGSAAAPLGTAITMCDLVTTKLAENVVAGDEICINGVRATIAEVKRADVQDDGSINIITLSR